MVETIRNERKKVADLDNLIYQLIEFFFVIYFVGEWLIRFLALRHKLDGLYRVSWDLTCNCHVVSSI